MRLLEIHIEVADLESAESFYTKLLPCTSIVRWEDGSAVALVLEDGSAFGIWRKGKRGNFGGRGGEHLHFAFQIPPDDYDAYNGRLRDLGLEVFEYAWPSGDRSLYFFDADGHQGEFMTKDWLGRHSSGSARAVDEDLV